jgi:hypothetical protein
MIISEHGVRHSLPTDDENDFIGGPYGHAQPQRLSVS